MLSEVSFDLEDHGSHGIAAHALLQGSMVRDEVGGSVG